MRHLCKKKYFNRTSSHKKLMFLNMCISLIQYETIKTTLQKSKELRRYIEPMITIGKIDSVANRRNIFNKLRSKFIVKKLFTEISPRYINRNGGYLRILRYKNRSGDNAKLVIITLL